jgi:hypothetical protein
MLCFPEFKAGRAEVCKIDRVTDPGPGQEYFVRLPDGYLLACGIDQVRAELVADSLNVMLKWASFYPPVGVIESIVRYSFAEEDRWLREAPTDTPTETQS